MDKKKRKIPSGGGRESEAIRKNNSKKCERTGGNKRRREDAALRTELKTKGGVRAERSLQRLRRTGHNSGKKARGHSTGGALSLLLASGLKRVTLLMLVREEGWGRRRRERGKPKARKIRTNDNSKATFRKGTPPWKKKKEPGEKTFPGYEWSGEKSETLQNTSHSGRGELEKEGEGGRRRKTRRGALPNAGVFHGPREGEGRARR